VLLVHVLEETILSIVGTTLLVLCGTYGLLLNISPVEIPEYRNGVSTSSQREYIGLKKQGYMSWQKPC